MNLTKQNAITLIALAITIVVLLILAGVALSLVVGEGGIVQRTIGAKNEYDIAGAKEKLELEVANYGAEFYQAKYVNGDGVNTIQEYVMGKFTNGAYADNFTLEKNPNNQENAIKLTSNTASDQTTTVTATMVGMMEKILMQMGKV